MLKNNIISWACVTVISSILLSLSISWHVNYTFSKAECDMKCRKPRFGHSSEMMEGFVYKVLEHLQGDQEVHMFQKQWYVCGSFFRKSWHTHPEVYLGLHVSIYGVSFSWREFGRKDKILDLFFCGSCSSKNDKKGRPVHWCPLEVVWLLFLILPLLMPTGKKHV